MFVAFAVVALAVAAVAAIDAATAKAIVDYAVGHGTLRDAPGISHEALKAKGNSLVIVEHDEETMRRADHIIDLGPEGGSGGGRVVATGTPEEVARVKKSYTGRALKAVL